MRKEVESGRKVEFQVNAWSDGGENRRNRPKGSDWKVDDGDVERKKMKASATLVRGMHLVKTK